MAFDSLFVETENTAVEICFCLLA